MATGGTPFDDSTEELHNWTVTNGSLEDRLNNMDWGVQQKKANRSSEKNKKKLSAAVVESRLTNDISPESTPGAGRRRARTPHSFPHIKYTTQMSVPDQAELDKLRQRINFTDLDERSIGSDSQGRVTAANNQRQLAGENKKPYNFLPLHVNTNKSKELLPPSSSAPATPAITKETKKQSPGLRDTLAPVVPVKDTPRLSCGGIDRALPTVHREYGRGEARIDSSQVVSKLVQIREYISKASSMRDDLVEKNDVPANVERLSHLIEHLKEQEKSYLRFLQKMLARENDDDDVGTLDSAVGSGSVAESTSLNIEVRSSDASNATGGRPEAVRADQKEELENLRKQHELLKKMLEQQEQLRALQGRQEALMAMQHSAERALAVIEDTAVVTETTGSVSGLSITSELNDELNDLIQRFHNQLHDSQSKAVPDNRRQAESLSLSREVCWSRSPQAVGPPQHRPLLHSASGPHTGLDAAAASAKLSKLQELQDKKQTMDKILQELHSLRDQTLNNNSCRGLSTQCSLSMAGSSTCPSALCSNGASASTSFHPSHSQHQDSSNSTDKLRKLKEVHKRLNELRELVQYYEQTSDMMVDAVNVKEDDDEEEEEEDETEDGSMFEAMFDSEQENRQPVTNIRNPQRGGNWSDLNSLTNSRTVRSSGTNNRDGRLNTECEINNRSAANLRSLNIPSVIACQYNRDTSYNQVKDEDEDEDCLDNDEGAHAVAADSDASGSSRRSSLGNDAAFVQKVHRRTAKQKLRQLQELVAMVQSDDTDGTTANEDETLHQQPNNTRSTGPGALGSGSKQNPRDLTLSSQAREKLYVEKLRQQKQELKQLHEERQRLIEIQGKIQDLQWACPDIQSSVSSTVSQQGLLRKVPLAVSTPAAIQVSSCSGTKTNSAMLKPTAPEAATSSVTDNELWSEMRRHQILREELRQRRKHLESLMAEHQRRSGRSDSPHRIDDQETIATLSVSRDERTMATWGSTPCHLDVDDDDEVDDYQSGMDAEEEEEQEECAESSTDDDIHIYSSSRNQRSFSNRKNQGSNLKPPPTFSGEGNGHLSFNSKVNTKQQQQQSRSLNQPVNQHSGTRRQENLRWASDLSFAEGSCHWQEQVSQLQKQLDFSTSMCQTLLQDQQTLSYMLQTLLTGQCSILPNNVSSPQVQLMMHQLNQCYTQLAWQQNNVQRLKQVLNELLRQQQQQQQQQPPPSSVAGWQTQKQTSSQESSSCPSVSHGMGPPFSSTLQPLTNNMPAAALSPFPPSFNLYPLFPAAMGEFPQGAAGQATPEHQKQQLDPNTSIKTEYMSFPPPLQRTPLNSTTERGPVSWLNTSYTNNTIQHHSVKADPRESPPSSPTIAYQHFQPQDFDRASQGSFSSMPDPVDPTTITKTFKTGRKASAQANLASRTKTPNSKSRRRRNKGHNMNNEGRDSDSASSTADGGQERAPLSRGKDQNQRLLAKLTQEKLDSKMKMGHKQNDLSSAYAWRTPFLSNRIACTEAPDASSDFSLFEALRETIYSEVATLISQNESRPHFLIELFHELQLLNTDYLRQRALYSLQDIVTRHLTEKSAAEDHLPPLGPVAWAAGSQSELTPSESLATSDAEVVEKNVRLAQDKKRDDVESVGNESTMSTSSNLEPFANDDLGNTVIHLDKALARIREYERMKLKAEFNPCNGSSADAGGSEASNAEHPSANPATSLEGAVGDVRCPQIDTQQLDRQIKAIMTEVIPFLKENMDEVCSLQLLTSVRRMVLTLTQQNDDSKEFVRFFHRQLGGILQDSLSKFVGRTLKDCGEDLLVEISEILFNELAFFKLMQDLDSSNSLTLAAKHKNRMKAELPYKAKHNLKESANPEANKSVSPTYSDEDKDQDEAEQDADSAHQTQQELYLQTERKDNKSSEASEAEEEDEDEGDRQGIPLSISLSKAETQALTNYGSGEDENEEEEMEEFEAGPVDVQTSLQVTTDGQVEHEVKMQTETSENKTEEKDSVHGDAETTNRSPEPGDSTGEEHNVSEHQRPEEEESKAEAAAASEENTTAPQSQDVPKEPTTSSSPDTDSPVMISVDEVGSGNTSQRSDEEDFVKVDDLPLQLTVMCEEELQKRIVEEQQNNNLSVEILRGNTESLSGLVGNAQALKEPEIVGSPSV
ncbi:pericentriolar material 1 protein isoform X2 [Sphaeramia orbicularis]|uniref:pericentriolar material 1 protein isoform X2 n=1 Tax=Sphaeramia orbicularis TaxID=375764 RepID=UPI0011809184|nr:pericentriolar material 1 protein isoform X2 [Sphaeramia orbicularis]